jgi:citrate synthase
LATLYAYVSRGHLQAVPDPADVRRSLFPAHEVEQLLRRRGRSRRPAAQTLAALRDGLPVLETAVAGVVDGQPHFRGRPALPWAREATLEQTARLLWQPEPGEDPFDAPPPRVSAAWRRAAARRRPDAPAALSLLARALEEDAVPNDLSPTHQCAALLRLAFACMLGVPPSAAALHLQCRLAWSLPASADQPLREALVIGAENEMNLPSFVTRAVGSAEVPVGTALLSGLCCSAGRFNGGRTTDVEAMWDELLAAPDLARAVRQRLAADGPLPGFVAQAYPAGDPRAARLLQMARKLAPLPPIAALVRRRTGWWPSVDFGLVALRRGLGAPPGAALVLQFAPRCAGMLAHLLEQRASGLRLALRALYDDAQAVTRAGSDDRRRSAPPSSPRRRR